MEDKSRQLRFINSNIANICYEVTLICSMKYK